MVGELTCNLNWGLLVVSDLKADYQQLPDLDRDHPKPVLSSPDAVVVRVRHGSDGPVTTRVWVGEEHRDKRGACELGQMEIAIPSGSLIVSGVAEDVAMRIKLNGRSYEIQVGADNAIEPEEIDIVLIEKG